MTNRSSRFFSTSITKEQAKDSGMAIMLILMIIGFFTNNDLFYKIAIPVLLMNMIFPMFYYPFAILWFGLSNLLGTIVSKILLSIVFFIIVLPVALLRRMLGKDSLLLKKFKKSSESVMKTRNQTYVAADLEKPF
jgi:hypothetical protein